MITMRLQGDKALIAKFKVFPNNLRETIFRKMTQLAIQLEAHVKRDKLDGQVLNVVTGRLSRSIAHEVNRGPESITARVFSGGNVPYAAIHEYGGIINHPGGTPYFIDHETGLAQFVSKGSAIANHMNVAVTKPHQIPMPERSYMRTSLRDFEQQIVDGLNQAAREAWK